MQKVLVIEWLSLAVIYWRPVERHKVSVFCLFVLRWRRRFGNSGASANTVLLAELGSAPPQERSKTDCGRGSSLGQIKTEPSALVGDDEKIR